jgi:hypothetical protein
MGVDGDQIGCLEGIFISSKSLPRLMHLFRKKQYASMPLILVFGVEDVTRSGLPIRCFNFRVEQQRTKLVDRRFIHTETVSLAR